MKKMLRLTSLEGETAYIDIDQIHSIVDLKEIPPGELYTGGPCHNGHPKRSRVDYGRDFQMLTAMPANLIHATIKAISEEDDIDKRTAEEAAMTKWLEDERGDLYSPELKLIVQADENYGPGSDGDPDWYYVRPCDENGVVKAGTDWLVRDKSEDRAQILAYKIFMEAQ